MSDARTPTVKDGTCLTHPSTWAFFQLTGLTQLPNELQLTFSQLQHLLDTRRFDLPFPRLRVLKLASYDLFVTIRDAW